MARFPLRETGILGLADTLTKRLDRLANNPGIYPAPLVITAAVVL